MTFYKNLGSITFEYETKQLEIFSANDQKLIFQFKHSQAMDIHSLGQLVTAYQFMLKDDHLLQLYTEKHKPPSILLHKASIAQFQRISIHFLCQIIKQMTTTIFQTRKFSPKKIGEITKQMFFYVDGHLRYLYFPVHNCQFQQQQIVAEIVQFFGTLKDQKQVSHRLLLKKISKCVSLESIIEETDYFMAIYHSKQSTMGGAKQQQIITTQQSFKAKTIKNPYMCQTKVSNQNKKPKVLGQYGRGHEISTGKSTIRRKYNLFKETQEKSFRNPNHSSQFNLSTWRRNDNQFSDQNSTVRSTSKGLHIDMNQRSVKKQSSSQFKRASSLNQNCHKISNRSKLSSSAHTQNSNDIQQNNDHFIRSRSRQNSKHREQQNSKRENNQFANQRLQSRTSGDFDESMSTSKQLDESYGTKSGSSSEWMKQMVNNSLDKWRQKSKDKGNLLSRIKHQDKEKSTVAGSRSSLIMKPEKQSFKDFEDTKQNKQETNNFLKKRSEILTESTQMTNQNFVQSENKLKRGSYNRSTFLETTKQEIQVQNILERNSQQIQPQCSKNFTKQEQKVKEKELTKSFDETFQRLSIYQNLIDQIPIKDKDEQEIKQVREPYRNSIQQEKIIKQITQNQLEIQKSLSSKNKKNSIKQFQKVDIIQKKVEINGKVLQFQEKLKQIILQKQQIDFLGIAVVQTAQHLKSFQSIFWQLPMFFLYKKFYQKRMQLSKDINQLFNELNLQNSKEKTIKQLFADVSKNSEQISQENENIEQSLKKLLKTVKKKIKKQYPRKDQQQYVEKHLHLDFSILYDDVAEQFISMYLQSLLEAKQQFPELVFHIIDIFQAISAWKGQILHSEQKESFNSSNKKPEDIQKAEKYFETLLRKKQIKEILRSKEKKQKGKK